MSRRMMAVAVLAGLIAIGGCVSQSRVDELESLYRRSQEQVENLKAQLEEAEARIAALQAASGTPTPELLAQLQQALAERDQARKALADAENALRNLGRTGVPILEPEIDAALQALAASNPDLMSYIPELGMVRFNADLTFPLGSTDVNAGARSALQRLAPIVGSNVAQKYELRIVGHTDTVPISRADTRSKHPTNWHLSVHRAIAVKDVLASAGVPNVRMIVAGAGEYRPVVPNASRGGAQPNRRVEIYLVPSTYHGPDSDYAAGPKASAPASAAPAAPAAPAAAPEAEPTQPDYSK